MQAHMLIEPMIAIGFLYIAILAMIAGLTSGMLGGGGNILAMPFMLWIYKYILNFPSDIAMKITIATSLSVMMFSSISATIAYAKSNNVETLLLKQISLPLMIGSLSGAECVNYVDDVILQKLFAGLLLLVSIYLFFSKRKTKATRFNFAKRDIIQPARWIMIVFGFIVGFNAGLLGLGSGIIVMPVLFLLNYPAHKVAGTASACTFIMSVFGTLIFSIHAFTNPVNIPHSFGFIYLPALLIMAPISFIFAQLGVSLSIKLSNATLFKCFTGLLFILGIIMLK